MNVNYEKIDAVRGEITVTLEEKDYADKVKKQLKEIAKNRPEPGFRPGHTPEGIIRRKYGDAVKYDVINREIGDAVYNYIREEKLHVLGNPVPVVEEEVDFTKPDFTFKFKVGVAPELEVKLDDLKVPFYTIKVTDEMVKNQDEQLCRRFGTQGPGEVTDPTALVKGVITELNEDGTVKEDGITVENGIIGLQYISEEQRKLFEDKHPGDVVRFNPAATCSANPTEMSSMLNIDKEDINNHLGDFNFDIKEIIVLTTAKHDEEFYNRVFGPDKVHDEKEYDAALREMIARELLADSNYRFTIDVKNALLKAQGDVELPDDILKDYLKQRNEALTDENIDEEYAKMRPELIWQLIRDKIAEQLKVEISEKEIKTTAQGFAAQQLAQYGMGNAPVEVLDQYAERFLANADARERIVNQAFDTKLFAGIKDAVKLNDKEVSVEEFNKLFTQAQ